MTVPGCWFATLPGEHNRCEGPRLVRCHLIDQQWIRQAFPKGAIWIDGRWLPPVEARFHNLDGVDVTRRALTELQADPRAWRPGCGGLVGLTGHHGRYDGRTAARNQLTVPWTALPADTIEYAAQLGLTHRLQRRHPR